MTSKISLVNLGKQSAKHNLAMAALLELLYFCTLPLAFLMMVQTWQRDLAYLGETEAAVQMVNNVTAALGYQPEILILGCICAALLGIWQFKYLHNAQQVDFYHSFPVKREELFWVQYLTGFVMWAGIYAINLLLAIAVAAWNGLMTGELWILIGKTFVLQMIGFLVIYSFMILAMMLTGKILVAILGMAVFILYGPGVSILQKSLSDIFLVSYSIEYLSRYEYSLLSPFGAVIRVFTKFQSQQRVGEWLLALLLTAVLVAVISMLLYRKRGSEMAGHAMAFPGPARIIKFLLLIPLSLVTGVLFYSFTGSDKLWILVGSVFGFILFSALIEFIYCMDIREIFRDRKQMVLSAVAVVAVLAGFRYDVIGFDRNLPNQSQVESVEVSMSEFLGNVMNPYITYIYEKADAPQSSQDEYYWVETVNESGFPVPQEELSGLYELLETRMGREEILADKNYEARDNWSVVNCTFHMKNGKEKSRTYWLNRDEENAFLKKCFEDPTIRKTLLPVLSLPKEKVEKMKVTLGNDYCELEEKDAREVFEIFCEEWEKISFEEIVDGSLDSEMIELEIVYTGEDGRYYGKQFWVGDGFEKTRERLKQLSTGENEKLDSTIKD